MSSLAEFNFSIEMGKSVKRRKQRKQREQQERTHKKYDSAIEPLLAEHGLTLEEAEKKPGCLDAIRRHLRRQRRKRFYKKQD